RGSHELGNANHGSIQQRNGRLNAGGRKYDDVTQVSKPAVSPTSQSADRPLLGRLRIWKSARQQVWKPALQNTSRNLRRGALSEVASKPALPHSDFVLLSSFVLRHSSFLSNG